MTKLNNLNYLLNDCLHFGYYSCFDKIKSFKLIQITVYDHYSFKVLKVRAKDWVV